MKKFSGYKKTFLLSAAALALVGSMSLHGVMAYFTTNVSAKGGQQITLGSKTTIEENVENMTKHIVISNTGEKECYVRVKVFVGSQFTLSFSGSSAWSENEDGYWYYSEIVPVGGSTEELLAKITVPEEFKDSFNVVVVQECTPVLYDESGNPYADWSMKVDTKTDIGTAGGEEADGE